ncbi:penicillin-binding protein 2 [Lewinellaceae bacterium SD302]|nr:penicillin-binding protein 2 [Lewinellaceae bacterium SD302]
MVDDRHQGRVISIRAVFILGVLLLIGKAFHLQIISDDFRAQADSVGNTRQTQYPSRGLMIDRKGKLLTVNQSAYEVTCTYRLFREHAESFDTTKFCRMLQITPEYFVEAINKDWTSIQFAKHKPFVFLRNIPQHQFATFQEIMHEFPGFQVNLRSLRAYPFAVGGHLVGYMGEVDQPKIDREPDFYRRGDYVGVSGIEYKYENTLRGKKGNRWVAVDRLGREVGETVEGKLDEAANAGADLLTTIDIDLQAYGEELMEGKIGSIVAIEPATGEILCMVSSPSYDLRNMAIGRGRSTTFSSLMQDTLQPLLNRAINGKYPPGSPFKTVVALAAMQDGTLSPDRGIACKGAFYSNGQRLTGCHNHPYCKDVETAIAQSCNNYFITAWLENINSMSGSAISPNKGFDHFNDYLYQFGLGTKTGIDYPGEIKGNVPTAKFYADRFAEDEFWRAIWVRSLAIGQGEYEITNLQMANLAAAIANRGHWLTPHLVRGLRMENDSIYAPPHQIYRHDIDIEERHFETVVRGMRKTFQNGTARWSDVPELAICGKTGTAENAGADHSILFAFAPMDKPKIAISVYIENGGFGSTYAAPIASLLTERFINGKIADNRKWVEKRMKETYLIPNYVARSAK